MSSIKKDVASEQTAAGFPSIKNIASSFVFSEKEISVLRNLASQVLEISERQIEKEKAKLWKEHNDLENDRPLVFADPENGWNEIIDVAKLECFDPLARVWEMFLRKQIFWALEMKDDKVIEQYFDVPYSFTDDGWGFPLIQEGGENGGAYAMKTSLIDYDDSFNKLRYPKITIDKEESDKLMDIAQNIFSGILNVRRKHTWWWSFGMTVDYIKIRGLENFMLDMFDNPEGVHKMMKFLSDGMLDRLDFLEKNDLLSLNTEGTYVGSGGFGYTKSLPVYNYNIAHISTKDMWGFSESQETVGVSPDMFAEFILPYQVKILERFGLNCYGCCEPIDVRWQYIKTIPNLRRVSCSAWANVQKMSEDLGKNYILSVKPNPAHLALPVMDENIVRGEIKNILRNRSHAIIEIIMKDNNTLGANPRNITRWVEIAREEIDK